MSPLILDDEGWQDEIHDEAITRMKARVCFFRAVDDDIEIIWQGKARVQHLYNPQKFQTTYESNALQRYRFQLDPDDLPPLLDYQTKARVLDGHRDPDLLRFLYLTEASINSSDRAIRTIELSASQKIMDWDWDVDAQGVVTYG